MTFFFDRKPVFFMHESKTLREQNETLAAITFNPYCINQIRKASYTGHICVFLLFFGEQTLNLQINIISSTSFICISSLFSHKQAFISQISIASFASFIWVSSLFSHKQAFISQITDSSYAILIWIPHYSTDQKAHHKISTYFTPFF